MRDQKVERVGLRSNNVYVFLFDRRSGKKAHKFLTLRNSIRAKRNQVHQRRENSGVFEEKEDMHH